MSLEEVKGIGPVGATKLVAARINNADELSVQRPEEVQSILGITLKQAKDIILNAKDLMYQSVEILDGDQFDAQVKSTARYISSGSLNLDSLIGGGYKSTLSHGLMGEFGKGKSQFVDTAVIMAVNQGYDVCYVETEPGTFNLDRLKEIAKARGLNCDGKKIHVWGANQVGTVYAQFRGYEYMWKKAEELKWDVGLFVVDSFNKKFRLAFAGREMYPDRAKEFGRHLDYLEEFAKHFNSATLLTFQVGVTPSEDAKGDQMEYSIENYPVGGTLVLHNVQTWISLKKIKGGAKSADVYEANLFDHNYKPKGTITYQITDMGVVDF